jgi:shikimate kinase
MKIFVIGMPGSGKSTLGKELAAHLAVDFIDLDAEIEKSAQKVISEIFKDHGEVYFREVEARLLRAWAGSRKSFVMATGGGAPCNHQGMDVINATGLSIFLDCPVSTLIDRVRKNQERPLLLAEDENELREKLNRMRSERLDCYRQATIIAENPTLETVLKSIESKR